MKPRSAIADLTVYVPGKSVAGGIKLSSNENPLGPSPRALSALRDSLTEAPHINRYPDGAIQSLKARIARFWGITEEMIVVGNGSDEILVMIAGAFMESGDTAITARNTFSQYTFATSIFAGSMKYAPMNAGRVDLDAMAGLIDESTRIVYVCNPNNPTATAFGHDEFARFIREIPQATLVVVDEAYGEFADQAEFPRTLEFIEDHENVIRLRTFSKIYGLAGLRVGYGVAQPSLISTIGKLRQPFNVGSLSQIAATAALDDDDFVSRSIRNNNDGRARLCRCLDGLGIAYFESQANFVCACIGPDAAALVERLRNRGLSIRPLGSFGLAEHVRISIGTPDEVNAMCEALVDELDGRDQRGPV